MRLARIRRNIGGASAVEFALTAPAFLMLIFGVIEFGLIVWTKVGLQHGVEMAARCATINTTTCGSTAAIQTYAAQQTDGLNPPTSTFTVSTPICGNQVAASYSFHFVTLYFGTPTLTLKAQSCFPK